MILRRLQQKRSAGCSPTRNGSTHDVVTHAALIAATLLFGTEDHRAPQSLAEVAFMPSEDQDAEGAVKNRVRVRLSSAPLALCRHLPNLSIALPNTDKTARSGYHGRCQHSFNGWDCEGNADSNMS